MKRTKFRYWNNKEQKMYSQSERGWDNFPCKLNKDDKWLEFTGLKDKNGVEIYEGDIVLHNNEYWRVEWRKLYGCWILLRSQSNKDDQLRSFQNDLLPNQALVIGNIYENPELLKRKNEKN